MFSFLKKKSKKEAFWDWFNSNKSELEAFMNSKEKDYSMYEQLGKKLHDFNELLHPEIAKDGNQFTLIITPDGIKEGITATHEIVDAAPQIQNWQIKKFRQVSDVQELTFDGLKLNVEDIKIFREFDLNDEVVDIAVLIKNYNDNDSRYKNLGFLFLDHLIGEFNVLTRVRYIDFANWNEASEDVEFITLPQLRKEIEENLY